MSQVNLFIAALIDHLGWNYSKGSTRCTGVNHYHDCSGYVSYGLVAARARELGYCGSSFTQAAEIIAAGTAVSREVCRATPGMVATRPLNNPIIPGEGHIVVSAGIINGVARTYEAHSTASGVIMGYFDGNRGFTTYGAMPGLTGFGVPMTPIVPLGTGEDWMIEDHPSGDGSYWMCDAAGHVYAYPAEGPPGKAIYHGGNGWTTPSGLHVVISGRVIGFKPTVTGNGYFMCDAAGHIYAFGDAHYLGGAGWSPAPHLPPVVLNGPCVGFNVTRSGRGYHMVSDRGSLYAFGDARRYGDPYGNPRT